jgi:hypothetical protein
MKNPCIHCEVDQLKKIVKDAIQYIEDANSFGDELDADDLREILKRPIQPSTIMYEEDEDGVLHQQ